MNDHHIVRKILINALVPLLLFIGAAARAGDINTGYFGNVAIKGYDPVAYFTMHRPQKGSEDISMEWLAAKWYFANDEHRKLFAANPVKFAPQYGGYCADGVAYGDTTANIDPAAWRIIDGKLYLNYDQGAAAEIEDIPGQLDKAVANWPKVQAALREKSQ